MVLAREKRSPTMSTPSCMASERRSYHRLELDGLADMAKQARHILDHGPDLELDLERACLSSKDVDVSRDPRRLELAEVSK